MDNTVTGFATNEPQSSQANSASAFVSILCPDISVAKTADQSPISAGETASFTITVTNLGPGVAKNVTVHDPLPAGVDWALDAPVAGCAIDAGTLDCTFASLAQGAQNAIVIHVAGETDFADCAGLDNTVTVHATNELAQDGANDTASASIEVDCPVVGISKTADHPDGVSAGDRIGFTVTIANTGAGSAFSASADDVLPSGFAWMIESQDGGWSITPQGHLVWGPATLAGHSTRAVHVVADTNASQCGLVPNAATASLAGQQVDDDSAAEEVLCPDVRVTKVADADSVSAGDPIGFTITISNAGEGVAKAAFATDTLPGAGWTIESQDGGWKIENGVLSFAGDLDPDASSSVHIVRDTTAADCGTVSNTVTVGAANEPESATSNDSASDSTDVLCAFIDLTKVADAGSVSAGDQIGFTVSVSNSGAGTAKGVTVDDPLPAGFSWAIESQDGGWSIDQGHLVFGPASLASKASSTVHIVADTTAADCATVTNSASVSTTNDGSAEASDSVDILCPDVRVTKVADADSVSAGDPIGFTITISNAGEGVAKAAFATDTLPGAGWTIESQDGGWKIENGVLSFAGDLDPDASSSVHIVRDTTAADCGTVSNTVTVGAANEPESATSNDSASDSTDVLCAFIDLTKVADAGSVSAGDQIGFTVSVSNSGAGTAKGVTVDDPLPAGFSWAIESQDGGWSIDQGHLVFGPASLASKASSTVHIVADTTAADCATVTNSASVSTTNDGSAEASDSVDILCPDITVEKTADVSPINAGEVASFTIDVWNGGPGMARGVTVSDTLPAGVAWTVDGTEPAGIDCSIADGVLTCDLGDLPPAGEGDTNHVRIHVSGETQVAACAEGDFNLDNSVVVAADNEPADAPLPNSDDATVEVLCPDLLIGKTADHADPVNAGDQIGFTITIANNGNGTAAGLTASDVLPAGFDWTIASQDGGWTIADGSLSFAGDLAAHTMNAVHIVAATDQDDCGTVPNSATLFQDQEQVDDDSAAEEVVCPDIDIDKTASAEVAGPGQTVHYSIDVFVAGVVASGTVTDVLPDGQTYVDGSQTSDPAAADFSVSDDGRTLTWTFDSPMSGDPAATIGYDVTIDADASTGEQTNTATFCVAIGPTSSDQADRAPTSLDSPVNVADDLCDDDTATVRVPGLTIEKSMAGNTGGTTDGGMPIALVGDTLTYTLDYTLTDGPVTDGVITDVLPAGLTYQDDSATSNDEFTFVSYDDATRTLTWTADSVTTSGSVTYQAVVADTAARDTDLTNTVTIDSAETAPVGDSVTTTVPQTPAFGLVIDKSNDAPVETIDLGDGTTAQLPTAEEGDTVTYTLAYTLTGDPVTGAVITDVLPDGIGYVDGSASSNDEFTFVGYDADTRTLTWTADSVTGDGSLSYDGLVEDGAADLAQPLVNVATIDSNETSPDSDDSSVFVKSPVSPLTPPPTDTLDTPQAPANPGFALMLVLLLLAGLTLGIGIITPTPERVRRRDRRDR